MSKPMHKAIFAIVACGVISASLNTPTAFAQAAAQPAAQPVAAAAPAIPLNAVLVLTPEFCATVFKQGSIWTTGRETFKVGAMACKELEPALKPVFAQLSVVKEAPAPGTAQAILIPKFANTHATTSVLAFTNREMDVLIEWTVEDAKGKTVWLQTVQGSSKHLSGNMFTYAHQEKALVRDSVADAAKQSATAMAAAPEILKLVPGKSDAVK